MNRPKSYPLRVHFISRSQYHRWLHSRTPHDLQSIPSGASQTDIMGGQNHKQVSAVIIGGGTIARTL